MVRAEVSPDGPRRAGGAVLDGYLPIQVEAVADAAHRHDADSAVMLDLLA